MKKRAIACKITYAWPARAARRGKLDPVIGRDEEVRRIIQVLSSRTKNNPVLIGEPGKEDSIAVLRGIKKKCLNVSACFCN
uniref:hypothetical protein n=1 Tax=Candidatus Electronema sp. TaxID=2698783 RepID=UPI004057B1DB